VPFTTLLSVALLGETVRWRRWTGIAMSFSA
jgi:drug/metabolite transporter (DMT)-like permease